MSERILKQLSRLQKNEPSVQWSDNARNFLVSRVRQDTLEKKMSWLFTLRLSSGYWLKQITPSPAKLISIASVIVLVGGTSMVAQAEYIPKRALYTVKRTFEKIELVLAVSPESETRVRLKHVAERQLEAVKLAKTDINEEEKSAHISSVVKSLEQDITAAKNSLEIVKEENKKNSEVVELAKEISDKAVGTIDALNQVKESLNGGEVDKTVSQVQSAVEDAEYVSLEVLVEDVIKGDINPEIINDKSVSKEEITGIINKKIDRTENKLKQVNEVADSFKSKKENLINKTSDTSLDNLEQIVGQAVDNSAQALQLINEAKKLLEEGSFSQVLAKLQNADQLAEKSRQSFLALQVNFKKAEADQTDSKTEPTINSATSSQPFDPEEKQDSSTTQEILRIDWDNLPANFAPLGGQVVQSATPTDEVVPVKESTEEVINLQEQNLENSEKFEEIIR